MSFKTKDDNVNNKYNNILNKIKDLLSGIRLSSDVIYDEKYIKTKVKDKAYSVGTFSENIPPKKR